MKRRLPSSKLKGSKPTYFFQLNSWTPFIKGGFQIFKKRGGPNFSQKKGAVSKIGGCFKKEEVSTNCFQCYLCLNVWCVCVLFIYTIPINIICDSEEEPILAPSN